MHSLTELAALSQHVAELRVKYKIPLCYDKGVKMKDGSLTFSLMDSDITIHPDGSCTETHMGLNSVVTGHEFITRQWPPK